MEIFNINAHRITAFHIRPTLRTGNIHVPKANLLTSGLPYVTSDLPYAGPGSPRCCTLSRVARDLFSGHLPSVLCAIERCSSECKGKIP